MTREFLIVTLAWRTAQVVSINHRPQRRLMSSGVAEFPCQVSKQHCGAKFTTRLSDRVPHHIFVSEPLKNGGQVGKCFVKRRHVGIGWQSEVCTEPVKQCVCNLMHDYVMRQCSKDVGAALATYRTPLTRREIAKEYRAAVLI